MANSSYSIVVYGGLLATVLPGLWGWFFAATVDSWPRWLCLLAGLALGLVVGGWRFRKSVKGQDERMAQQIAEQVAGEGEDSPRPPVRSASEPDTTGLRTAKWMLWFLGPPCWVLALAMLGNRFLDTSDVSTHTVELIRVEDRYKGQDVIVLTSWRQGEERLSITRQPMSMPHVHAGVAPGTPLVVSIKPGAFGWQWIVGITPKR
ncbi:MAG: hypothetical protein JRI68_27105 [Deltaproteobacteria bacterium]|nr:hypothetical protein [Deltaproteobacteria bacterium]